MISIIIIVKNDPAVENTIKQLISIPKPQKTEIIVVDSSKGKLDYLRNRFKEIKWITFTTNKNKRITIPEQRNVGVHSAKGDIIVFIDANCIPQKDWLINLTYPIIHEGESITCGKTTSHSSKTLHDQFHDNTKDKTYLDECATINLALIREVFNKIGYFDEKFNYGSDVDFTWRTVNARYKILYIKNAVISHDWGNINQEIRRSYYYGEARGRLYSKHKKRVIYLLKKDFIVLIYPLFIIFLPVTFIWPYYPLLLLVPFLKNINNKPLKVILDHLVYGSGVIKGAL